MFEAVLKKMIVAVVFTVILFLCFHRAVAATSGAVAAELEAFTEFPAVEKQRWTVDCSNLKTQLRQYRTDFADLRAIVMAYFNEISGQYVLWSEHLEAKEGTQWLCPADYFAALPVSFERLNQASPRMFEYNSVFDENLTQILDQSESCLKSSPEKEAVMNMLTDYLMWNNEHLSSQADFPQMMAPHVAAWYESWHGMEGIERRIDPDYFSAVAKDAKDFQEAAFLTDDSAQRLLQKLDAIIERMTPLPVDDGTP